MVSACDATCIHWFQLMTLNGIKNGAKSYYKINSMITSGYDYQKDSTIMSVGYGRSNGLTEQRAMDSSTLQTSLSSIFSLNHCCR